MAEMVADMPNRTALVATRNELRREARSLRENYELQWEKNARYYRGTHNTKAPPEGHEHYQINWIQNAVIASAAIQTEQRPRINITARETDDPPIYYLKPGMEMALASIGVMLSPGQMAGVEPMDEQTAQQLAPLMSAQVDPMTGMEVAPAMLPPDSLIMINDQVVADTLKLVIQTMWDNSGMDFALMQNVLNCGVIGNQPMLAQWDDEKMRPEFQNVHLFHVWIDPISTGVEDADYVVFDEVISADKAKRLYPDYIDVIEKNANSGQQLHDEFSRQKLELGGPYYQTNFERNMVTVSTMWRRYQPIKLTADEALSQQLVAPQMEAVGMNPDNTVMEEQSATEDGKPLFLNENGEQLTEGDEAWPTKIGIEQVRFIGDTVIDVRECPYSDIPVGWNVNIPQPYSPYGQGEPERLESLQMMLNRLLSVFGNHIKYYQFPTETMSQSMYEATKAANSGQTHSRAGRVLVVPDDQWNMTGGKITAKDAVPDVPTSYVQLAQQLTDWFSRISGNQDVLQGVAPGADMAAEAIRTLQSAARGPIGFKSTYTERMLTHIVKLMIGMAMDFLPEAEWAKIVSKYPQQVLLAIRDRAKIVEYDTSVDVVSGKGSIRQAKEQQAVTLAQMGQIDNLSLLEGLEYPNAKQVNQRVMSERAMAAPVQQGSPPKNN